MGKIISDHLATKTYLDDRLTELRNHFEIRFKDQLNEINNTIDRKFTFHTTIISAILGLTLAIMGLYLHYLATLIEKMAN